MRYRLKHNIINFLLLLGSVVLAIFMFIAVYGTKARAHSPDTHQTDSLADAKSEAYGLCCNGEDWVRISQWETTASGYRIFYKGEWLEGSRSVKVRNIPNPDADAKAWIYYMEGKPYIRCFMPSAQS